MSVSEFEVGELSNRPNPFKVGDVVEYCCIIPYFKITLGDVNVVKSIEGKYIGTEGGPVSFHSRWKLHTPINMNMGDWL